MRTLQKAYHTRNGPLFVRTVSEISSLLKAIKSEMMANALALFDVPVPLTLDGTSSGGVPVRVWKMICEEVYQRSVGPDVEDTKKYKSFSSETYGELNPS
jgi:[histone H3]-lysine79 N-trimethyltransferase